MAKSCELCIKKIGIFEKIFKISNYNSLCSNCYEHVKNKLEEESRPDILKKKEIECEQRLIKERVEIEKENKKMEIFKFEFIKSFSSIASLYKDFYEMSHIYDAFWEIEEDIDIFNIFIIEMHKKIGDTKSISDINNILSNESTINELLDKVVMFKKDYKNFALKSMITNINNYYVDDNLLKFFYGRDIFKGRLYLMTAETINSSEQNSEARKVLSFSYTFSLAFCFIKSLILVRNIENFMDNKELYIMYTNLKQANLDSIEISNKLFPIYNSYYSTVFNEIYNESEFKIFVEIFRKSFSTLYKTKNLYISEMLDFKNKLNKDVFQYSHNEYTGIISKYYELLIKIDSKKYFDWLHVPYDLSNKHLSGTYRCLHRYILLNVGDKIPEPIFFELFADDIHCLVILENKLRDEITAKERDRLLSGNLSKEKEQERDRFNFENINNGYEFEHYLKNVFDKLGYISIVTKASGDQGADLIIEKDSVKTVVQAKYYTNPVGNKAIQEVVSAIAFYKANKGMVVTNSIYTKSAIELAGANNIALIDGEELGNIRNEIIEKI